MASTSQNFTSGQVLTAAEMDQLPQGILSLASSTSNSSSTTSTTSLDILTATAVTPAQTGRRWRVRFQWRGLTGTVSGDVFNIRVQEGSTVLNEQSVLLDAPSIGIRGSTLEAIIDSPTVASHTYKATITRATGTGTAQVNGSSTFPMLLYVEDAGQA